MLLSAVGGALGACARAVCARQIGHRFPWGTFLVNAVGSFLLGLIVALTDGGAGALSVDERLVAVGFCGGFTTFSAFSHQTVQLLHGRQFGKAAANVLLNLFVCLAMLWAGLILGRG